MVPLLPLRDGVRALPISFFRQSMPSFYMNAPDCICSPGRLPLGAFCTGRDDQAVAFRLARSAISIHAPRVGRDAGWAIRCIHYSISIHAPRAGCDPFCAESHSVFWISIHAPRAGCDGGLLLSEKAAAEFQSTHPVRGATTILGVGFLKVLISIHAPRAGCDNRDSQPKVVLQISIHAPRAGCDSIQVVVTLRINQFQSTHPVRGATCTRQSRLSGLGFQSTHPVRGATRGSVSSPARSGFQSTHPVRGATGIRRRRVLRALFQSTHPVRGATMPWTTMRWPM